MKKYLRNFWVLMVFVLACTKALAESAVPITPAPQWLTPKEINFTAKVPTEDISYGVYHLLLDWQTRVTADGDVDKFRRFVQIAVNPEGVEDISQINIDFDPSYQTLQLHQLTIWREGQALSKLNSARMTLLSQEKELDKQIYNGERTLNILIDDVHKNDILEYSYSISGDNPVFAGGFSLTHGVNWGVPVEHLFQRVLWQKDNSLQYTTRNTDLTIHERALADATEYWIEQQHVKPIQNQKDTPYWDHYDGYIYFSDAKNWADVAKWGTPLFEQAITLDTQIQATVKQVTQNTATKSQQIAAILNFVQDEIRYVGIEFGENSHKPSNAIETLSRAYGDCKDKVVLLLTMLRAIEVNATPALVNTTLKQHIAERLPSMRVFDHVIAKIDFDGQSYWFDPTRQYQADTLANIYQPDYGYALLLDDTVEDLTKVAIKQPKSTVKVIDTFRLNAVPNVSASYQVDSQYRGDDADNLRSRKAAKGLTKIRSEYLNWYQKYYDSLEADKPVVFEDNLNENRVSAKETYQIKTLWQENQKDERYYANFYVNLISPHINIPKEKTRRQPLSVEHPVDLTQHINIYFETDDWSFDQQPFNVDNEFFTFDFVESFDAQNKHLSLQYRFVTKTPRISPQNFPAYVEALEQVDDYMRYRIQQPILQDETSSSSTQADEAKEPVETPWLLIIAAVYFCLIVLAIAMHRDKHYRNPFTGEMKYYPVSIAKFVILFFVTLGVYATYWFYRNWQYVKQKDNLPCMPFARGFFSWIWFYPFYQKLAEDKDSEKAPIKLFSPTVAAILAVLYFVGTVTSGLFDYTIVFLFMMTVATLPLLIFINALNKDNQDAIHYNSRWHPSSIIAVLLFMPLFLFSVGYDSGLTPSDKVISGQSLPRWDVKYLVKKSVIKPKDKILWFYSAAFISNRDDGNGFTDRHVFSYENIDGEFAYYWAEYDDIANIESTRSNEWSEDTVVTITKKDESEFLLFVSTTDDLDKMFVKELKALWKKHHSAAQDTTIE